MPNLNRKGPLGEGAQTGRKLGKCNPNKTNQQNKEEEISNRRRRNIFGRGRRDFGLGLGGGQKNANRRNQRKSNT